MARLGGPVRSREMAVFKVYEKAVGQALNKRTQPESLRGTTLIIRASSSPVAHQVVLLKAEILDRIGSELGPAVVTDLRTRVGPLRSPSE
jgi:hypothetical protein